MVLAAESENFDAIVNIHSLKNKILRSFQDEHDLKIEHNESRCGPVHNRDQSILQNVQRFT